MTSKIQKRLACQILDYEESKQEQKSSKSRKVENETPKKVQCVKLPPQTEEKSGFFKYKRSHVSTESSNASHLNRSELRFKHSTLAERSSNTSKENLLMDFLDDVDFELR